MIHLKVGDSLKAQLKEEASERGLSLCAYIRMILLERKNQNE